MTYQKVLSSIIKSSEKTVYNKLLEHGLVDYSWQEYCQNVAKIVTEKGGDDQDGLVIIEHLVASQEHFLDEIEEAKRQQPKIRPYAKKVICEFLQENQSALEYHKISLENDPTYIMWLFDDFGLGDFGCHMSEDHTQALKDFEKIL